MTRREIGVAAAALVLGGGAGWWAAPRERPVDPGHAGEVVALRRTADEQDARLERLEAAAKATPAAPAEVRAALTVEDRDRGTAADPEAHIAALEREVASLEARSAASRGVAAPEDPVLRTRKVLESLKGIRDPRRQVVLQDAVEEISRIGDPAIPEVVAVLDSGLDRLYDGGYYRMSMGEGRIRYAGLRMALIDSLRQIRTPAAEKALVAAVRRSGTIPDYRDLIVPYRTAEDPGLVEGITALVPDILRRLAEKGIGGDDPVRQELAQNLSYWILQHGTPEMAEPLAEVLAKSRPAPKVWGIWGESLFCGLVATDPIRAADLVLSLEPGEPDGARGGGSSRIPSCSYSRGLVRLSCWARYADALVARESLSAGERAFLYGNLPTAPCANVSDVAERIEDARVLVAFLERRLDGEPDAEAKKRARIALDQLRESISREGK